MRFSTSCRSILSPSVKSRRSLLKSTSTFIAEPLESRRLLSATLASDASLIDTTAILPAVHFATAAPTVTGVSPNSGPAAGGTLVTITGTNFPTYPIVYVGSVPVYTFVSNTDTQIVLNMPAESAGTVDVLVKGTGLSAASPADQFTYLAAASQPTVAGVSPNAGPLAGGTSVTITGTGFTGATSVDFGGTAATNVNVVSATQITATDPAESAGTVDVTVTTPGGTSATSSADQFSYVAAPAVTGVSPTAGPLAGGTSVTITGTNFNGATLVDFGTTPATNVTIVSGTQITATDPAESAGTVDVTVTTPFGTSVTSSADQFSYVAAPAVTGVSPNADALAGGTSVTITGTNFNGATLVDFGSTAATNVTVVSGTQITATDPAESAGTVDVTVTTPFGTSTTSAADQFSYVAAPAVTGVSPNADALAGGTSITITGTNFSGATAVDFGSTPATNVTVVSGTQITATDPAESAGTVDVTVTTPFGTSTTSAADQFTYNSTAATPVFTNLSGPLSINTGTASITLSGTISAGNLTPPSGENVGIYIQGNLLGNGQIADSQGDFSVTVNTSSLPASTTPYPVTYTYGGDANFNSATDNTTTTLTVNGVSEPVYRLYSPVTNEHLFTSDVNEYNTLATRGWIQENVAFNWYTSAVTVNGVTAEPVYRLYDITNKTHLWTTDSNEYNTWQAFAGTWSAEGVVGYVFPTQVAGSNPLYRLSYGALPDMHFWTTDGNEVATLDSQYGWNEEGVIGYVM